MQPLHRKPDLAILHRLVDAVPEQLPVVERPDAEEAQEAVQLQDAVLYGRAGQAPAVLGLERRRRLGRLRIVVFDVLRFV